MIRIAIVDDEQIILNSIHKKIQDILNELNIEFEIQDFTSGKTALKEKTEKVFDIIFLDPPYNKGLLVKSLNKIYEYNLLSENGIIVAETETDGEDITSTGFDILKSSRYGKTVITVMQR